MYIYIRVYEIIYMFLSYGQPLVRIRELLNVETKSLRIVVRSFTVWATVSGIGPWRNIVCSLVRSSTKTSCILGAFAKFRKTTVSLVVFVRPNGKFRLPLDGLLLSPGACRGTRWRSWLRHCATGRKVAGVVPDGATEIFHWHNPSGGTMALGLTQPLTEMSTRNISWWVKAAGA